MTKIRASMKLGNSFYLDPSVRIIGIKNLSIGRNTVLSEDVWINVNHRDGKEKKVIIGNNCHIGKSNYFSSGPLIIINDYCFTGIDCHFLGCGHVIDSPFIPYLNSGLTEGGAIEIGANCWLTTSVTVMQGVKIGYGSIIGARSVVVDDIPPFSIAVGNPCKVIKRFDFKSLNWIKVTQWTSELENLIIPESQYLDILKEKYGDIPQAFIASGKRFGWL